MGVIIHIGDLSSDYGRYVSVTHLCMSGDAPSRGDYGICISKGNHQYLSMNLRVSDIGVSGLVKIIIRVLFVIAVMEFSEIV